MRAVPRWGYSGARIVRGFLMSFAFFPADPSEVIPLLLLLLLSVQIDDGYGFYEGAHTRDS